MYEKQIAFAHRINQEQAKLTIELIADLHCILPIKPRHLQECLTDMKQRDIEHVAILGDFTNNGFHFQWKAVFDVLKEFPMHYYIPLGNHDVHAMKQTQLTIHPLYKELILQDATTLYYERQVQGVCLLILNPQTSEKTNAIFFEDQLQWLEKKITQHQNDFVIVFAHHPLAHTHPHTDTFDNTIGIQTAQVKRILKQHPHLLYCSAHIHNSYSLMPLYVDQGLCCLHVPPFKKINHGKKRKHLGYHVEVYHDFLYIKTRDYGIHEWITSQEWIVDIKANRVVAFDQDFLENKAVQQKSKQN